jgi:hypothetical protein
MGEDDTQYAYKTTLICVEGHASHANCVWLDIMQASGVRGGGRGRQGGRGHLPVARAALPGSGESLPVTHVSVNAMACSSPHRLTICVRAAVGAGGRAVGQGGVELGSDATHRQGSRTPSIPRALLWGRRTHSPHRHSPSRVFAFTPREQALLTTESCFVLDCGSEVFVWTGKKSPVKLRNATLKKAQVSVTVVIALRLHYSRLAVHTNPTTAGGGGRTCTIRPCRR